MEKLKNVRPGVLIIADAGLKLTPGQTIETPSLTEQMEALVASGHLARVGAKRVPAPARQLALFFGTPSRRCRFLPLELTSGFWLDQRESS